MRSEDEELEHCFDRVHMVIQSTISARLTIEEQAFVRRVLVDMLVLERANARNDMIDCIVDKYKQVIPHVAESIRNMKRKS